MRLRRSIARALFAAAAVALAACSKQRPEKVPGETDLRVAEVSLRAPGGEELALDHEALLGRLGLRAGNALITDRYFNPYRLAEDRRRIAAFWQTFGYFDVEVEEPKVAEGTLVSVAWTIHEGARYTIREVVLQHAPPEHEAELRAAIPFGPGEQRVDLEAMRKVRHALADRLRHQGFGHATVYSRVYVDRKAKSLDGYYLVDAGPKTVVGKIVVEGNIKLPASEILARTGLRPGAPYDLGTKERAELDLLDTGAFASAAIRANTDTELLVPGDAPDSGGILKPEQTGPNGELVPRKLDPKVGLTIIVVEAPSERVRLHAGFEIDPSRADTTLGSEVLFRNLFGPDQHLRLEGRLGYGVLFDAAGEPGGLYGEALARYEHPGLFARLLDARLTIRYRDVLYPGFHLRELTTGPGARTTIAKGFFFDVDALFRLGQAVDFGPFDAATHAAFSLPQSDVSKGGELDARITWDGRNDPIEPTSGFFAALGGEVAPFGTTQYARVDPELRAFVPLGGPFSLAGRASGGFVVWKGDAGVPLGPRLFGGGAFGMRGFGLDQLSPYASCSPAPDKPPCPLPVGGLSLVEASVEARWLPKQKFYGAAIFADLGGAGRDLDPFGASKNGAAGINVAFAPSLAAGLGLRLRLWYLPMAFDFAYRIVDEGDLTRPSDVPLLVFFRVGESF